jgi:hypothetical protein
MAGRGGAQQPDYRPRVPGIGAASTRTDMTTGSGLGPKSTPITGAPTTGVEAPYGQRSELLGLQQGAPLSRGGAPPRAGGTVSPSQLPTIEAGNEEPVLPPLPPIQPSVLDAYGAADMDAVMEWLPDLHELASLPDATEGIRTLAEVMSEIALHLHSREVPPAAYMGPRPVE